jgi:diguanylate cyclase (GGDEF)-like protein
MDVANQIFSEKNTPVPDVVTDGIVALALSGSLALLLVGGFSATPLLLASLLTLWAFWLARRVRQNHLATIVAAVADEQQRMREKEAQQKTFCQYGPNKLCVEVLPASDPQSRLARRRSEKSITVLSGRFVSLSKNFEQANLHVETAVTETQPSVQGCLQTLREEMREVARHGNTLKLLAVDAERIAGQANLLALNAAIEAAKAGGEGGGLALLAEEMGSLSDQSTENARHLAQLVKNTSLSLETTNQTCEFLAGAAEEPGVLSALQLENFSAQLRQESAQIGGEIAEALLALQAMADDNRILSEKNETARICFEDFARQLNYFDTLTDLPNRRLFTQKLKTLITEAGGNGGEVALLHIGLDRFAGVNESLSFETGDLLLIEAASRLAGIAEAKGLAARLCGDEFLLALAGREEMRAWRETALTVREKLGEPYSLNGHEVHLSASIGFAAYPTDANSTDTLLAAARMAMRAAKATGRNNVHFYSAEIEQRAGSGMRGAKLETE